MYLVFQFDSNDALQPILVELQKHDIAFQIQQTETKQELWIADQAYIDPVLLLCEQFAEQKKRTLSIKNLKDTPVIFLLLIFTALSAFFTQLGESNQQYFFIAHMIFDPRSWQLYQGIELAWHSISPIFLHFGIEHVIFNSLMFWYLGSLLERLLGHVHVFVLIILLALCSNYAQLFMSGPLFGGLSGVVYGLMMFAFCYQFFIKPLFLPKGLLYVAIVWLLLGLTPVFPYLGLGNMANTAHISGVLAGLTYFIVFKLLALRGKHEY